MFLKIANKCKTAHKKGAKLCQLACIYTNRMYFCIYFAQANKVLQEHCLDGCKVGRKVVPSRVDFCSTSNTPSVAIHDEMEVIYIHIFHYILIPDIFWNGGGSRPIRNTSPFWGLHARARHDPHQSMDEARSASVHPRKKNCMGRGQTHRETLQLIDQLSPEGRVGEKEK